MWFKKKIRIGQILYALLTFNILTELSLRAYASGGQILAVVRYSDLGREGRGLGGGCLARSALRLYSHLPMLTVAASHKPVLSQNKPIYTRRAVDQPVNKQSNKSRFWASQCFSQPEPALSQPPRLSRLQVGQSGLWPRSARHYHDWGAIGLAWFPPHLNISSSHL